jgi:Domain of unknown function (DUF4365)
VPFPEDDCEPAGVGDPPVLPDRSGAVQGGARLCARRGLPELLREGRRVRSAALHVLRAPRTAPATARRAHHRVALRCASCECVWRDPSPHQTAARALLCRTDCRASIYLKQGVAMSAKGSRIDATPYSKTAQSETAAVYTLQHLLMRQPIAINISTNDKRPNIDGDLELQDRRGASIGKLEVQVKHLSSAEFRRSGYSCKLGFLTYCATASLPVLLIGVNSTEELALWQEVSRTLARELLDKAGSQGSVTLRFPSANIIRRGSAKQIAAWRRIARGHQKKLEFHDEFAPKAAYLLALAQSIESIGPGVPNPDNIDFASLQKHVDEINSLFERMFPTVREALFGDAWKIGVAFLIYNKDSLALCYYPVRLGVNDLLIRRVQPEILNQTSQDTTTYPFENPIAFDPVGFAREYTQNQVIELIKNLAFRFDDLTLCREFFRSTSSTIF